MAEDLSTNIENYKLQLQQVEAALTTSPDDDELLKLKQDLEEVIELTQELLRSQLVENASKATKAAESAHAQENEDLDALFKSYMNNDEEETSSHKQPEDWSIGDRCRALSILDGQYHDGTIEAIDGQEVSVLFDNDKKNAIVTTLDMIKEIGTSDKKNFKKPALSAKMREYQKKKKQKKLQRYKQLEEERESEKNKWINFHSKTYKKGITKKSIFASPDSVTGRVGIGTCGVSGKGMTEYQAADHHKKSSKK